MSSKKKTKSAHAVLTKEQMSPLASDNRKKCVSLIRSVFSTAAGFKLDFDNRSGHIIVKASRFWTFEFEYPCVEDGSWFVRVFFAPEGSLSSRKMKGWMLEAKSHEKLEALLHDQLNQVGQYTQDLLFLDMAPQAPPIPKPTPNAVLAGQSGKVLQALQAKPELLWRVAQDLAALRLASPWEQKVETREEDQWFDELDPDTGESRQVQRTVEVKTIVWRRQALGWEGQATVATVTHEGSRWMVHWVGCAAAVPNPNLESAMNFADRMLTQEEWTLL